MRYSRFFAIMLLSFLITAMGWTISVVALPSAPGEAPWWFHTVYARKIAYAEGLTSRRVVIVAGSNALFGLSAAELTHKTGVPAVNMSLHGGLGLRVLLDQALRVVRHGDLVVMPIEYELYQDDFGRLKEAVGFRLAYEPLAFIRTEGLAALQAIFSVPADQVLKRTQRWLDVMRSPGAPPMPEGFNEQGDYVKNVPDARDAAALERLQAVAPQAALLNDGRMSAGSRARLTEFVQICRSRGVTVVATYPNAMDFPVYRQPSAMKLHVTMKAFYGELGVPLVGEPGAFFYPRSHFYDTVYHLLRDAQLAHTHMLIRQLKPYLQDMRTPVQPEAPTQEP